MKVILSKKYWLQLSKVCVIEIMFFYTQIAIILQWLLLNVTICFWFAVESKFSCKKKTAIHISVK